MGDKWSDSKSIPANGKQNIAKAAILTFEITNK